MQFMFFNARSFNQDITNWDTSSVSNMERMFSRATSFNQNIKTDGDSWNTSAVTNMKGTFEYASAFDADIATWDTSNVTNMYLKFSGADALKDKKGGDFNFATSNEMWRASFDILDFMPLTSADYGGGLIITDWYNDEASSDQSVKISIRFLSNEIRTDALKITVFSKECEKNINCRISQSNPKIENELKVSILKRAAKYKKDMIDAEPKRDLNTILTSDDRD